MNILAVDDEPLALDALTDAIREAEPDAELAALRDPAEALDFAGGHTVDVAFLDVQLPVLSGLELAKRLKKLHARINIIFVTGYADYRGQALDLFCSGYVMKPPGSAEIARQLENLRFPIQRKPGVYAETFGEFRLLLDGEPVVFERSRSREILALLVDGRGRAFSREMLAAAVFPGEPYDLRAKGRLDNDIKDMVSTLKKAGIGKLLIRSHNSYAVDTACFDCDLYEYEDGDPRAVNAFQGRYMTGYPWAAPTLARLYGDEP